jgi:hypothetical protein
MTYDAGDNCSLWECLPEWFLIAYTILNDHNRCALLVDASFQLIRNSILIDCFVCTDDVVKLHISLCHRSEH